MRYIFTLFFALTACQPTECTMIGCMEGVSLTLKNAAGSILTGGVGTIIVDGDTSIEFDCSTEEFTQDYTCLGEEILFHITEGSSIEYNIEAEGYTGSGIITIDFEEIEPNGEGCGVCYNDYHDIELDAFPVEPQEE